MSGIWGAEGDDRSVSPVVATILVVAITIVIATAIGATVFGFTDRLGSTTVAAEDDQCVDSIEFDPADVSSFQDVSDLGCVIWLDASKEDYSSGDDVTKWTDRSPNGFDMTESSESGVTPPSYAGQIEGVPAVEFQRADTEGLTTQINSSKTDIVSDTTLTVTALVHMQSGQSTVFQAGQPDGASTFDYFRFGYNDNSALGGSTTTPWFVFAGDAPAGYPIITGHRPTRSDSLKQWMVVTHIHDGSEFTSYVNGQQRFNAESKMNISDGVMQVGYELDENGATGAYMDGYVSEIIIFEKSLNHDQRKGIECALDRKHGDAVKVKDC